MNPRHECATCGDVADRATIVAIDGKNAQARLDGGAMIEVAVDLTPGVGLGDVVLVHQGVAIGTALDNPAASRLTETP